MNLFLVCQSYGDNPPKRIINTMLVCRLISLRFINLNRAHIRHGVPFGKANSHAARSLSHTYFSCVTDFAARHSQRRCHNPRISLPAE